MDAKNLIVGEDPVFRTILETSLSNDGHDYTAATDGQPAL